MTKIVNKIVDFDKYEAQLVEFETQFKTIVYDFSDAANLDMAKEDRKTINKAIKLLDETHTKVKADLLVKTKLIDSSRKSIKDRFIKLKESISDQLDDHANIAIKHAAMLHQKVEYITNLTVLLDGEVYNLDDLLDEVKSIVIDSTFESREADGHMAKAKAIEFFEGKIAVEQNRKAELEKQRIAEEEEQLKREENIRQEAAAEANKQAEIAKAAEIKAKKDADDAAKKAEEDKKAAEIKAKKDADDAVAAEQKRIQEISDNEKAEREAKEKNQKHRAVVHKAAKDSLIKLKINEDLAVSIVKAISKGLIKNVKIEY